MKNPLSSKWLQLYIRITHIIPPEQTRDKKADWKSLCVKIEVCFKRSFSIASCILLFNLYIKAFRELSFKQEAMESFAFPDKINSISTSQRGRHESKKAKRVVTPI